jgi:voltage-gated potassium channel
MEIVSQSLSVLAFFYFRVNERPMSKIKDYLHEVIFEAETPEGKAFDVILLVSILLSVLVVFLESVSSYREQYGEWFYALEWFFTILFTVEYVIRIWAVDKPYKYATSFFGVIDLASVIPTYLSFFVGGLQGLLVIRVLRLLRVFRIFKLGHFMNQGKFIIDALRQSRTKILLFLYFVLMVVIIVGTLLYLVEADQDSGFTSIPRSIYWAIVTLTTVGYGDIAPQTELGQILAAIVMLMGYAIIAVPTGIVSSEMSRGLYGRTNPSDHNTRHCPSCSKEGHDIEAKYCKHCGRSLMST